MIRNLGLVDIGKVAGSRSPDIAVKPVGIQGGARAPFDPLALLWNRIRHRKTSRCLVDSRHGRVQGLVCLGPRNGPSAWTVDHLVVATEDDDVLCDLLRSASRYAAQAGAERLLLTVPPGWHIRRVAIRSGFTVVSQVLLYTLPGRRPLFREESIPGFRRRQHSDDHSLLRLYSASTPAEVRSKLGLTLYQWRDSNERRTRRTREFVLDSVDGSIQTWLRLDHHRRWTDVRMMLHPESDVDIQQVIGLALRESGRRAVWWEVPEFQWGLQHTLEHIGFEAVGCFMLMICPLVPMVRQPLVVPAPSSVA